PQLIRASRNGERATGRTT
ncbi:Uncharacterized protein HZ326_3111, partial [Fusarium oxysporum f. sp. albedinis]